MSTSATRLRIALGSAHLELNGARSMLETLQDALRHAKQHEDRTGPEGWIAFYAIKPLRQRIADYTVDVANGERLVAELTERLAEVETELLVGVAA